MRIKYEKIIILIETSLLFYCFNKINCNFENTSNQFYEKPNIVHNKMNNNFDTGYFYQTEIITGKNQIDENFYHHMEKVMKRA